MKLSGDVMNTYIGKLLNLARLKSSPSGNPRYALHLLTDNGELITIKTAPNSSHGYSVTNYRGKRVAIATRVVRNELTLNGIEEDDHKYIAIYRDGDYPVYWEALPTGGYRIKYGADIRTVTHPEEAAELYASCVLHSATCAGLL